MATIIACFTAVPEVWLDVLCDTPILFLRLLQTNKTLNTLWSRVLDTWRRMTARLIEMKVGAYVAQVYPFFVVENERFLAHRAKDRESTISTRCYSLTLSEQFGINAGFFSVRGVPKCDRTNEYYYYVAYDEYTRHFVEVLQYLTDRLHDEYFDECPLAYILYTKDVKRILITYLGLSDESMGHPIACYLDGFLVSHGLVNEKDVTPKFSYPSNMSPLIENMRSVAEEIGMYVKVVPDLLDKLALSLKVATKPPKAIRLDAKFIRPYYENLLVMYANEPQCEKTLFLRLFGSLTPRIFSWGQPSQDYSFPSNATSTQSPRPSTLCQAWRDDDTRTPATFNFGQALQNDKRIATSSDDDDNDTCTGSPRTFSFGRPSQEYATGYPRPFTFGEAWRDNDTQKPATFNFGHTPQNDKRITTTALSDDGDDTCTGSPRTFSFGRPSQEYGTQSLRPFTFGQASRDIDIQKPATFTFNQAPQNDKCITVASSDDDTRTESPRTFFFGPLYQ